MSYFLIVSHIGGKYPVYLAVTDGMAPTGNFPALPRTVDRGSRITAQIVRGEPGGKDTGGPA